VTLPKNLMKPNKRLDKTINGLQELVQRHKKLNTFQVSKNTIIINNFKPQIWGTIFYVTVLLLLPAGLLVYYLLVDKTNSAIFWLFLFEILFTYNLYKIVRGNTALTIDFKAKQFEIENNDGLFKKCFSKKIVLFSDIVEVQLKETSIASKYSRTVWLRITATDKVDRKIVFTDLSNDYPESYIAKKIKFLIDVIIWTEKQNVARAV
jgi:hypothetical protein